MVDPHVSPQSLLEKILMHVDDTITVYYNVKISKIYKATKMCTWIVILGLFCNFFATILFLFTVKIVCYLNIDNLYLQFIITHQHRLEDTSTAELCHAGYACWTYTLDMILLFSVYFMECQSIMQWHTMLVRPCPRTIANARNGWISNHFLPIMRTAKYYNHHVVSNLLKACTTLLPLGVGIRPAWPDFNGLGRTDY